MEKHFALVAICEGNVSVTGGFPVQSSSNAALFYKLELSSLAISRVVNDLRGHDAHVASGSKWKLYIGMAGLVLGMTVI